MRDGLTSRRPNDGVMSMSSGLEVPRNLARVGEGVKGRFAAKEHSICIKWRRAISIPASHEQAFQEMVMIPTLYIRSFVA
jgi:hypothetical protein